MDGADTVRDLFRTIGAQVEGAQVDLAGVDATDRRDAEAEDALRERLRAALAAVGTGARDLAGIPG